MVSGYPISTSFSQVDGWSTDPQILGCHNLVSEPRFVNTYGLIGMGLDHCIHCAFKCLVLNMLPDGVLHVV